MNIRKLMMSGQTDLETALIEGDQPVDNLDFEKAQYQVVCICGGYGFPLGNASAARITTVGKALQTARIGFVLLHCGPSPYGINTQKSGVYEGIPFEYTTSVKRPRNRFLRMLVYLRALASLTARLVRLRSKRRNTIVYLYVGDGPMNLYVGCLCRILGVPVVQELCEWILGEPTCSAFNKWLYKRRIFELATGALVISKTIEHRVRERSATVHPRLLVHRLPAIVDARRFLAPVRVADGRVPAEPQFVYCGTWLKDVRFLIRAFASVKRAGYACKLRMVGGWAEQNGQSIVEYAVSEGLSAGDLDLMGCVDDRTLEESYKGATALLMPLWDDDRSRTRLPNKMGEYLATGRPVVTSKVGDLTDFLIDNVNAYLADPGNESDFAEKMKSILLDPRRADKIGAAGQQACLVHLDYRAHTGGLAKFFVDCVDANA